MITSPRRIAPNVMPRRAQLPNVPNAGMLGSDRAWVVHGADGIDEISTTGYTKVSECRDGQVNTFYLHPADAGLPKSPPEALRGDVVCIVGGEERDVEDVLGVIRLHA